ncbi:recombinase family protein, partial [bacterium]|nr:recombinase family protein [bacterium]
MMNNKENSTVILARVSSKAQEDEGYSLDSQMKLLQGYCEQRDLRVVRVFKIAETASKQQSRKVFHELLNYLNKEKIFNLAVEKTDRLTRNFKDSVAVDEWLEKDARRRLHAVKENLLLHKEAKSDVKFMWNIHLSVAKKYTDNLREEAMKGWAEKLAQGWLPAPPPPGYITTTVNGKKIHMPDPKTKNLVKKIFELYLEPGQSILTITNEMKRLGLTTRRGRPFCKSQVQTILNNPFYIGINKFNGREYPGAQQLIISRTTFEKVQHKMTRKTAGKYRQHNPTLKNMVTCSHCNRMITWQLQKGHFYGACQRTKAECRGNKLIRQDELENRIQAMLKSLICPSEEVIEWATEAMREKHAKSVGNTAYLASSM